MEREPTSQLHLNLKVNSKTIVQMRNPLLTSQMEINSRGNSKMDRCMDGENTPTKTVLFT
jgi:hypothetical protein